VESLVHGTPMLGTYLASADLKYLPIGFNTAFYMSVDRIWISEVITSWGIHYLRFNEASTCRRATESILDEAFQRGISAPHSDNTDAPTPAFLCAASSPAKELVRLVSARQEQLQTHLLIRPGSPGAAQQTLTSAAEAVSYLIGDSA
jgi:hypothetical protein